MKFLHLLFWSTIAFISTSRAGTFETQVEQPGSEVGAYSQFRLWVPSGSYPERLIALAWGSHQCCLNVVDDKGWQDLARSLNCGLLACYFIPQTSDNRWDHAENGSGQEVLDALKSFARMSREYQISQAPMFFVGDSQGGQFAFSFAGWKPDRVIGFVSIKGGQHDVDSIERAACVPGLFFAGQSDATFRIDNIVQTFARGRSIEAPWCLAIEPNGNHNPGPCAPLVRIFLQELAAARNFRPLPSQLAESAQKQFSISSPPVSWFPDKTFENAWHLFESGRLQRSSPELSFKSQMPPALAIADPPLFDLGFLESGDSSGKKAVRIQCRFPAQWDRINILDRPFLADCSIEEPVHGDASVSFRFDTGSLPLGRFSGAIPLRFSYGGNSLTGGLNIPVTANITGDVTALPSIILLGPVQLNTKISTEITITSKSGNPIDFLSCQTPAGVVLVSKTHLRNTLVLSLSFDCAKNASNRDFSGAILLHLKSIMKCNLRIPFVGLLAESQVKSN